MFNDVIMESPGQEERGPAEIGGGGSAWRVSRQVEMIRAFTIELQTTREKSAIKAT